MLGAQDAVANYKAKNPNTTGGMILNYIVMHLEWATEEEKAVEYLIRQHKLKGTIKEWLPGYNAEVAAVIGKRCRELFDEEYIQVMKTQKVVTLRMNPEAKKDGRRKFRLLAKGFMEPAH